MGIAFGSEDKDKGHIKWSPLLTAMEKYAFEKGTMLSKRDQDMFLAGWNAALKLRDESGWK